MVACREEQGQPHVHIRKLPEQSFPNLVSMTKREPANRLYKPLQSAKIGVVV